MVREDRVLIFVKAHRSVVSPLTQQVSRFLNLRAPRRSLRYLFESRDYDSLLTQNI